MVVPYHHHHECFEYVVINLSNPIVEGKNMIMSFALSLKFFFLTVDCHRTCKENFENLRL